MQRRRAWGSSIFEKKFFYVQKRPPTKFACNFLTFFEGVLFVRNFSVYRWTLKKIEEPHALHLCMLYRMVKKKFRKNIVEGKKSRRPNGPFLATVNRITPLNLHISDWNFYRRLSDIVPTYPENFSRFELSLAKIDLWGEEGLKSK